MKGEKPRHADKLIPPPFLVGDKVICVYWNEKENIAKLTQPVVGQLYTVSKVGYGWIYGKHSHVIQLAELSSSGGYGVGNFTLYQP